MHDFIEALREPGVPFLRYALIAGVLASVAFGVIGSYVVARRISYIAGAISHCVLGGIGVALYLQNVGGLEWCRPMYGAVASALAAAVVLGLVSMYARQREDTVIGALWATGMAVGLLFIAKTPGYIDPMSYLFGNILLISKQDLWMIVGLDALTVGLGVFFYHKFLAVCFDEEFARLRGVHVQVYYMLLLCLTALTVVLLMTVVGIVMVIALLTLPAAVAGQFSRRLWQMMGLAVLFCLLFTTLGLAVSYEHDLPSGPTIIVVAAAAYLAVVLIGRVLKRRGRRRQAADA
jgi:zinc transport system permease protein